jgi:hypothetical protein
LVTIDMSSARGMILRDDQRRPTKKSSPDRRLWLGFFHYRRADLLTEFN